MNVSDELVELTRCRVNDALILCYVLLPMSYNALLSTTLLTISTVFSSGLHSALLYFPVLRSALLRCVLVVWLHGLWFFVANFLLGFDCCFAQVAAERTERAEGMHSTESTTLLPQARVLFPLLDSSALRIGAWAHGWTWTQHRAGFTELPGVPTCCPQNYDRAVSTGFELWSAGILAEAPVSSLLIAALRLGYTRFGAEFRVLERAPVNLNALPGNVDFVDVAHLLTSRLATLNASPFLSVRPFKWLSVYLGATFGLFLQQEFVQRERVLDPTASFIVDSAGVRLFRQERNVQSGVLPERNPVFGGVSAGMSYEIPLNTKGTVLLGLEAFGTLGLSSPVRNLDWRIAMLHAGASLRFAPYRTTELTAQELQERFEDSLRQAQESVRLALAAKQQAEQKAFGAAIRSITGIYADGKTVANPTIRVERFNLNESRFLLNHLFFSEGSAVIPSRYKRILPAGRGALSEDSIARGGKLDAYYHILNILGKRLSDNPTAMITLTGCHADVGIEKGNRKLARRRAEAVAGYLQEVWGIRAERIIIRERDLPELLSPARDSAAAAEHRRVDITASNPDILRDVRYRGEQRVVEPSFVDIGVDITAGAGLKQWNLEISQFVNNEVVTLGAFSGESKAPQVIRWDATQAVPTSAEPLTVQLAIDDQRNNKVEAPLINIPVEQIPARFDVHLTSFDERRLERDERVRQAIAFIKDHLRSDSQVKVTGYTDPTGDAANDRATSLARAQAVAKALGLPTSQMTTVGAGASSEFDSNTPEGRHYNRFVRVEVKNPLR